MIVENRVRSWRLCDVCGEDTKDSHSPGIEIVVETSGVDDCFGSDNKYEEELYEAYHDSDEDYWSTLRSTALQPELDVCHNCFYDDDPDDPNFLNKFMYDLRESRAAILLKNVKLLFSDEKKDAKEGLKTLESRLVVLKAKLQELSLANQPIERVLDEMMVVREKQIQLQEILMLN